MSSGSVYGDPATRSRILDSAWELVTEQGGRFKLADVASRADTANPM